MSGEITAAFKIKEGMVEAAEIIGESLRPSDPMKRDERLRMECLSFAIEANAGFRYAEASGVVAVAAEFEAYVRTGSAEGSDA